MGNIEELAASIEENGLLKPMQGYKDGEYYIPTDGHRRFAAIELLLSRGVEIVRVPFISEKKKSIEQRTLEILLSNDGKPLTPIEMGNTYKRLMSAGWTQSEIARKTGKSVPHITNCITICDAPKEILSKVESGQISAHLALQTIREVGDADEAAKVIVEAAESRADGKKLRPSDITTKKESRITRSSTRKEGEQTYTREEVQTLIMAHLTEAAKLIKYMDDVEDETCDKMQRAILNTKIVY
jgi:ParB family chromosome partitioning protein